VVTATRGLLTASASENDKVEAKDTSIQGKREQGNEGKNMQKAEKAIQLYANREEANLTNAKENDLNSTVHQRK
jgi:hypothetical protein